MNALRLTLDTPSGLFVPSDSAFPSSGKLMEEKIVCARKINDLGASIDIPKISWLADVDTMHDRMMPSERQSAYCSVCAMK